MNGPVSRNEQWAGDRVRFVKERDRSINWPRMHLYSDRRHDVFLTDSVSCCDATEFSPPPSFSPLFKHGIIIIFSIRRVQRLTVAAGHSLIHHNQ